MAPLKPKVILDTNMVLLPAQLKIDIYSEIREIYPAAKIATTKGVLKELDILKQRSNKLSKEVDFAKEIMFKEQIEIIDDVGSVDESLEELGKIGNIIATNDKELRKKLQKEGIITVYLRNKERLVSSGGSL